MTEAAELAAIIAAFAGLVEAGASVTNPPPPTDDYMIRVDIQVDNLTNLALMDPMVSLQWGEVDRPPVQIASGYKEAMLTRKHNLTPTGSFGVVSWRIGQSAHRLVIMWSVPFEYLFYDNTLAVGIMKSNKHDPNWADEMYDAKVDHGSWYERAKYNTQIPTLTRIEESLDVAVTATMSTAHKAQVRVTFAPTKLSEVAECLIEKKDQEKRKLNK
ncbi:hypothetical protein DPMN_006308 [Dreissena polymorpha]|uniref:Uncharacterized protein n=1 Tax=Dreissena polymorpha TaxID=45954 RepID=A0A9D4MW97_DREPO|nr:hypothetical protein DPMN_006308 [Dreissena polymorpha]